jgi:hypothetical protein
MSSAADYYGSAAVPPTTSYGPPKIDFSPLANGLDTFVKGRQEGREEDTATAFRNGIPMVKDANGNDTSNPNYTAMYQRLMTRPRRWPRTVSSFSNIQILLISRRLREGHRSLHLSLPCRRRSGVRPVPQQIAAIDPDRSSER